MPGRRSPPGNGNLAAFGSRLPTTGPFPTGSGRFLFFFEPRDLLPLLQLFAHKFDRELHGQDGEMPPLDVTLINP